MAVVTPSAASSTRAGDQLLAPTLSPRLTSAKSLASSSSNSLDGGVDRGDRARIVGLARSASRRAAKALRSASSSRAGSPLASTIGVCAKWVSANAVSACWAAMIRGTTPVVTRSCALSSAATLTRLPPR